MWKHPIWSYAAHVYLPSTLICGMANQLLSIAWMVYKCEFSIFNSFYEEMKILIHYVTREKDFQLLCNLYMYVKFIYSFDFGYIKGKW